MLALALRSGQCWHWENRQRLSCSLLGTRTMFWMRRIHLETDTFVPVIADLQGDSKEFMLEFEVVNAAHHTASEPPAVIYHTHVSHHHTLDERAACAHHQR